MIKALKGGKVFCISLAFAGAALACMDEFRNRLANRLALAAAVVGEPEVMPASLSFIVDLKQCIGDPKTIDEIVQGVADELHVMLVISESMTVDEQARALPSGVHATTIVVDRNRLN